MHREAIVEKQVFTINETLFNFFKQGVANNNWVKAQSNIHFVILSLNILNLNILFISMIMFFEYMSMILNNHMFKINLSIFFKNANIYIYFLGF
jgi:hypothetical protein